MILLATTASNNKSQLEHLLHLQEHHIPVFHPSESTYHIHNLMNSDPILIAIFQNKIHNFP